MKVDTTWETKLYEVTTDLKIRTGQIIYHAYMKPVATILVLATANLSAVTEV